MTAHATPWSRVKLAGHNLKVLTLRRRLEMARERAQEAASRAMFAPRDSALQLAAASRWDEYDQLWRYVHEKNPTEFATGEAPQAPQATR